ncbi:hypothetical protein UK23_23080 [Lentzea aerocolonigenes]|uniref:Uncharacterized protein n=1 Tax=Lentzea aerocolonigenes TaxID=68170 RepID=A0A0F0GTG6_LENAE|nr:hypothetical protein UK23_23080 [Lentzea aerocolonigenes]
MIPVRNTIFHAETDSSPVIIAHVTVRAAPTPTHTAYAVPTVIRFMPTESPTMLSVAAMANTTWLPFDNAVAHTASSTALTSRTAQYI